MIKHSPTSKSKATNIDVNIEERFACRAKRAQASTDKKTQCMPSSQTLKTYTIVVCGDNLVGKKALINRFLRAYMQSSDCVAIGNSFRYEYLSNLQPQKVIIAGKPCYLKIETCALNNMNGNTKLFQSADAFIIIYSVDSLISFTMAPYFYDEIISVIGSKFIPVVLVANKVDIPPNLRRINKDEGVEMGRNYDLPFVETSARLGTDVELPFYYLVQILRGEIAPYCASKTSSSKRTRCVVM